MKRISNHICIINKTKNSSVAVKATIQTPTGPIQAVTIPIFRTVEDAQEYIDKALVDTFDFDIGIVRVMGGDK